MNINAVTPAYVLDDITSHIYETSVALYRPITYGRVTLRKARKRREISIIQRILQIDPKTQVKILDIMSETVEKVPRRWSEFPEWLKELDNNVKRIGKEGEYLVNLEKLFQKLDKKHREEIIKQSASLAIRKIDYIRESISQAAWEAEKDVVREFIIVDQVFINVRDALTVVKRSKLEEIEEKGYFAGALWLLIRLWCYKRKKLPIDELEKDLADITISPSREYIREEEYPVILEIL